MAGREWRGAYPEIIAYDYLNYPQRGSPTFLTEPVRINKKIDGTRTYSREIEKSGESDFDGYFAYYDDVFFDVKAFKDNVKEILESIYKEVYSRLKCTDLRLRGEYSYTHHYEELKSRRKALVNELVNAFDPERRNTFLRSSVVPEFSFQAMWGPGTLITMHDHDPYEYAERYHGEIFNHVDKFVRDKPSFIIYVVFHWSNLLPDYLSGSKKEFYRAYARRVFCQYRYSPELMKEKNSDFKGAQTVWEVSNDISAILFLEDKSILGDSRALTKLDAYWYINPNAKNRLFRSLPEHWLTTDLTILILDTFEHDNY
ncbi:MAG: hypothetical protein H0T92_07785 [Pyrinomonadaceae bacterium]|nr:hypothetical protein [Pyrinomonadaceae bacterium]